MTTAEDVARNLKFDNVKSDNLISYSLMNHANGDEWKEIKVVLNGADANQLVRLPKGEWMVIAHDGLIDHTGLKDASGEVQTVKGGLTDVPHRSALILARKK